MRVEASRAAAGSEEPEGRKAVGAPARGGRARGPRQLRSAGSQSLRLTGRPGRDAAVSARVPGLSPVPASPLAVQRWWYSSEHISLLSS